MKRLLYAATHDPKSLWGLRPWMRHSLVLLVLGLLYVIIGLIYWFTPLPSERAVAFKAALEVMAMPGWGVAFVVVGVLSVLSSRWPPPSVTWGYTVLSGWSTFWGCMYAWSFVQGAPVSTLTGVCVWLGLAFLWWAISGLQNPQPHEHPEQFPLPSGDGGSW